MSETFRNNLTRFNRKERFYVVREATKGGFELDGIFKQRLEHTLGITIPDQDVFTAMDYHLDWIYASLFLCNNPAGIEGKVFSRNKGPDNKALITASQEDVDLLVAAPDPTNPAFTNLIMIEAKGDTSWTNKQAESKANRLKSIFKPGTFENFLRLHYMIWSPKPSKNLKFDCFPGWALVNGVLPYLELTMDNDLIKTTCCDENGKNKLDGNYWKVDHI